MNRAAKNALMAGANSLPDHLREQAAANPNSDIRAQNEGMTSELNTASNSIRRRRKDIPEVGLVVCNSWSSNTGSLTGEAALRVIKKMDDVVFFSLPAMATEVARQLYLAREVLHLVVVDGCKNRCALRIIEGLGIKYDAYLNVEFDMGIEKLGPFTTFQYSTNDVRRVASALKGIIAEIRRKDRESKEKDGAIQMRDRDTQGITRKADREVRT